MNCVWGIYLNIYNKLQSRRFAIAWLGIEASLAHKTWYFMRFYKSASLAQRLWYFICFRYFIFIFIWPVEIHAHAGFVIS